MGILNVTPDSFYDGSKYNAIDTALFRVEKMLEEGADIVDIGGESTRPDHKKISLKEEIYRTQPIIFEIKKRFPSLPLSIDTTKSQVAKMAMDAGVDMVNDIWGLLSDREMAGIIAKAKIPVVLMHNRNEAKYDNLIQEIKDDLTVSINTALKAGIAKDKIILDPGIGFGKTAEHNLECIAKLNEITALGYPVLLGASNKSFIGKVLNAEIDERLIGTCAVTAFTAIHSIAFIRVHEIKENKQTIDMIRAIKKYGKEKHS